jgi:hypothetical protein
MTKPGNHAGYDGPTQEPRVALPPLPREEVIIPSASAAERELYEALMTGLPHEDKGDLEDLMIDNIERLRSDGDSYAP